MAERMHCQWTDIRIRLQQQQLRESYTNKK